PPLFPYTTLFRSLPVPCSYARPRVATPALARIAGERRQRQGLRNGKAFPISEGFPVSSPPHPCSCASSQDLEQWSLDQGRRTRPLEGGRTKTQTGTNPGFFTGPLWRFHGPEKWT